MNNWYEFPKWSDEYEKGLDEYIENAFVTRAQGEQLSCPCQKCCYRYWFCEKNAVKDHVISNGFIPRLEKQPVAAQNVKVSDRNVDQVYEKDDIDGLLHDTLRNDPAEESRVFYKLVEDGQQEFFLCCKNFSKLSFTIRLVLFKCDNKLSIKAFNDLLDLLRAVLPDAKLPSSYSEGKNRPRDMTWHSDSRPMDNLLRHPADGTSWKDFNLTFPAKEPRNVRLGLATHGFNPFCTMSISHSTWPVILMNYNLPPWMCMKPEYFMLALLIPGPQSPGNDIDIYMQPLIKELKEI